MNTQTIKLIAVAAVIIACVVFFGLWRYTALELKNSQAALKTANSAIEDYQKNNIITEEVANDYEITISRLRSDIKRLREQPVRCHPITSKTSQFDAAAAGEKLPKGNGIRSVWLYDFAGRCEGERLKVIGLQNFINRIYEE